MGNTPAHHKRRLSGDLDMHPRDSDQSQFVGVAIPPSKRRNMHSLSDFSRSAPPDYGNVGIGAAGVGVGVNVFHQPEMAALDEATSMLRATTLQEPHSPQPVLLPAVSPPSIGVTCCHEAPELATPSGLSSQPIPVPGGTSQKPRPLSAGFPAEVKTAGNDTPLPGYSRSSVGAPHAGQYCIALRTRAGHAVRHRTSSPSTYNRHKTSSVTVDRKLPTVFRWNGGGNDIFISGTFNNWENRIPMVKRNSGVFVIVECSPGVHEYKYFIDGAWYHDPTKPTVDNEYGTKNNVVQVKSTDFDVLDALSHDEANSRHRSQASEQSDVDSLSHSPPGDYGRYIPINQVESQRHSFDYGMPVAPGVGTSTQPPLLPPHLLQGILNKDTSVHCDPNLLPSPNHVIVNHLYALSIKDGVIVLSVITRYRQKFVSTLFYKPISD